MIVSRRDLLVGAGALVVTANAPALAQSATTALGTAAKPALAPDQLDSWIAVRPDGGVVAYFGKMDMGQGVDVAIAQIVADELDVAVDRVDVVMGDTALTVNQGGASGSTGVERGGVALRNAAAEARRLLVEAAGTRLGIPVDGLAVTDGVVAAIADPAKRVSYAELIGGRYFGQPLTWNGKLGNDLVASGKAKPKPPAAYKVVGTSVARRDIPGKSFGTIKYVSDIRLPGMLHGRMVRPPVAGAAVQAIDESSVAGLSGVRVVRQGNLVAVVAPREWDAIRAAEQLKVTWSAPKDPLPDQAGLYDHIRRAPAVKRALEVDEGAADAAFAGAARVIEAEYEWPFQSHASMAPACAVADVQSDRATIYTGSQKPHFTRDGVARLLGLPQAQVHGVWVPGPGSYGRNDAGDAAMDAALLSKAVGKPVRVQGMRYEGHGWDPKGPASVHKVRAALDAAGAVTAWHFESRGFSRVDVESNESDPRHTLAGQLTGLDLAPVQGFGVPAESYGFPAKRLAWETIPPLLDRGSPLRTSHLRDPLGPQLHFASESFIDELAAAAGSDPVEFRLRYLKRPRDLAVVKAVAERAGWQKRPAGRPDQAGDLVTGRGVAFVERGNTAVALVAEIEVDRRSGRIRPVRYVIAHDCGLVINPDGLRHTIEGNLIHATSRAIWEEVTFDRNMVTSVDWLSYPIAEIADAPEAIDIVLINRPELPPYGAGEASTRPVAAAIANALFDATGVRLRRAPFTPDRVKGALAHT